MPWHQQLFKYGILSWAVIFAGLCLLWLLLHLYYRRSIRDSSREANDEVEARQNSAPELVDADPAEFTWLDQGFYDQTQAEFEALGFRVIGNFENLTETRLIPYMRRFSRFMVDRSGTMAVNIVMIRLIRRKMPWKYIWIPVTAKRLVSIESETIDGVRLVTSNTEGVLPEVDLPGLVMQSLPPGTPTAALARTHHEAMDEVLKGAPEMHFKTYHTRADLIRSNLEEHEWLKSCDAYHKITATMTEKVFADSGSEDMRKVGEDMYQAYLRERDRRRTVQAQLGA